MNKCLGRDYISDRKPAVESDGVGRNNTSPPPPIIAHLWIHSNDDVYFIILLE
jgi:hypothetical protein